MTGNSADIHSNVKKRKHSRENVRIKVIYKTIDRFKEEYIENISHGGIFIKSSRPLPLYSKVNVFLTIPQWDEPIAVASEVVRRVLESDAKESGLTPGFALQFLDFDEKKKDMEKFIKNAASTDSDNASAVIQLGDSHEDEDEQEEADEPIDDGKRELAADKIKKMTMNEKMILAPKANNLERMALLKDLNPSVARLIIRNPKITDLEIVRISKDIGTPADVLDAIGKNRKWIQKLEIKKAIVKNPKTPSRLALKQLALLSTKEVAMLAKSQHVRDNIKREALKLLTQRRERGK